MNWYPDNTTIMIDDQWYDTSDPLERECMARGSHHWGKDKFADEAGVQGYHYCLHCFRCEPL